MIDVVCGVVENSKGQILSCLRPQGKHLGGFWEFPGGKVNPGESPRLALARELLEELSVEVEVGLSMAPVIWVYDDITVRLMPFRCRIVSGELRTNEHERFLWCDLVDVHCLPWAAADIPILREIEASLQS